MADRRVSAQRAAAEPREDSRERLAEADSNWVSEEPWEEQPGERRRPSWRLPVPAKLRAAAPRAVSIQPAPGAWQVLQARPEQPAGAQRVWWLRAAEQQVLVWQ
jgi:hypothetical protein